MAAGKSHTMTASGKTLVKTPAYKEDGRDRDVIQPRAEIKGALLTRDKICSKYVQYQSWDFFFFLTSGRPPLEILPNHHKGHRCCLRPGTIHPRTRASKGHNQVLGPSCVVFISTSPLAVPRYLHLLPCAL